MRELNPFRPGVQRAVEMAGRKEILEEFMKLLRLAAYRYPVFILLNGSTGAGKSLLLQRFRLIAEKTELTALLRAQKNETETSRRIETAVQAGNRVVLVDDCNKLHINTIIHMMRHKPRLVVFALSATKKEIVHAEEMTNTYWLELKNLTENELYEWIEKTLNPLKMKIGGECFRKIFAQAEGHPFISLIFMETLFDQLPEKEKTITLAHLISKKTRIEENLAMKFFDEFYSEASGSERGILTALAEAAHEISVTEIARRSRKRLSTVTTLISRLLKAGHVKKIERGTYGIFNVAYLEYIRSRV